MDKSVLTFPYQYKQIEFGKVFNPYIPIPVKARWGWQNLWFLVDSGADTTMLTLSLANQLGLNINKNKRSQLFGIGERSVTAFSGIIELKFNNYVIKTRCYFIDTEDSTLLLGRLDIFDKFNVYFDSTKQKVSFNPI